MRNCCTRWPRGSSLCSILSRSCKRCKVSTSVRNAHRSETVLFHSLNRAIQTPEIAWHKRRAPKAIMCSQSNAVGRPLPAAPCLVPAGSCPLIVQTGMYHFRFSVVTSIYLVAAPTPETPQQDPSVLSSGNHHSLQSFPPATNVVPPCAKILVTCTASYDATAYRYNTPLVFFALVASPRALGCTMVWLQPRVRLRPPILQRTNPSAICLAPGSPGCYENCVRILGA